MKVPYTPPHMVARAERVKSIWVNEYKKEQRRSIKNSFPFMISYSIGFYGGAHSKGSWSFLLTTLVLSVLFFYLFKWLTKYGSNGKNTA